MHGRRTARRGFTLAELMLVVAVITILSAIVLPSAARAKAEAQLSACVENLRGVGVAYQTFLNDNPDLNRVTNLSQLVPRYMKSVPTCPSSGASTQTTNGGYWLWTTTVGGATYTFVTCKGAHNEIIPATRNQYQGPTYSPRTGVNDGRSGVWVF